MSNKIDNQEIEALPVLPFDFSQNKQILAEKFIKRGYDATSEGSNAAILSDVLAYLVSMLNANVSSNIKQMLLSRATQEKNILYLAREQGYEPQKRVSFQYRITLVAQPHPLVADDDTTLRVYEIPKYTKFQNGQNSYYYFGDTITKELSNAQINNPLNTDKFFSIIVKEGELYLADEYPDLLILGTPTTFNEAGEVVVDNKMQLPFTNVEDDGIEMTLNYVDADGIIHVNEPWYKSTQFLSDKDTNLEKRFIRLDNIELGVPQLYFSIAGVGNELRLNTEIKINVLVSKGSEGVATGEWESPLSNIILYTNEGGGGIEDKSKEPTLIVTGADEENPEQIKTNAPLFHNSANRAVTKYDYVSICNRFANVDFSQCWGGDEDTPMRLGHVYLSLVPGYRSTSFQNDTLKYKFDLINKNKIDLLYMRETELKSVTYDENGNLVNPGVFDVLEDYKVMTVQLHNVHPFYLNFDVDVGVVRYTLNKTKQQIHQNIFDIVNNYFKQYVNDFDVQYFHSNLIKRVDTELTDSSGVELSIKNSISFCSRNLTETTNLSKYSETTPLEIKQGEKEFRFFLGIPFERLYEGDGTLIPGVLPSLDTKGWLGTKLGEYGANLRVNWNSIKTNVGAPGVRDSQFYFFDIVVDILDEFGDIQETLVVGKYFVNNQVKKYIEITFFVNSTELLDYISFLENNQGSPEYPDIPDINDFQLERSLDYINSPLTENMFNEMKEENEIQLTYKYFNLRLFKHMFPRLTSVKFSVINN